MFENEHDFRKLVAGLKIDAEPNPAHRERLRRQMLQTFEESGVGAGPRACPVSGRQPRRVWGNHRGLPLRIAAVLLIGAAVTAGIWSLFGGGPATFRQVQAATQRASWLYAVVSRYQSGEVHTERHWYNFAAQKAFALLDDGGVLGWDYGAPRQKLVYSPRLKALAIGELAGPGLGADSNRNLIEVFAVFAARDDVQGSTAQRDGAAVRAFELEQAEPGVSINGKPVSLLKMAILADPRTRRVVAASIENRSSDGRVLAHEEWAMSYPKAGPASVFDLGVPASATVIDRTRRHIGTPGEPPASVPTPAPARGFRLVPLEIRLPRPMFTGTPQNGRVPNLEKPRQGPRPPFLAPQGTTNLALGKPVTSSDPEPVIGSLGLITDGDKETADGSFVELGPGPQQVTIDLQERCEIYAVLVWHHHRWPRVYFDVIVQVCDEPTFRTGVKTIFNNDTDNALGLGAGPDMNYTETAEGKLIEGKGVHGRYVRLFSNGNTNDELNHYIEVEVYGRPLASLTGN
jgi:hypothetical protein